MNNNHLSFPHIRPKNAGDNTTVHETENTMSLISSVTPFRAQKTGVHAVARGGNNVKAQGVHVGQAHDAVGDSKGPPKYYNKCMVCRKRFNSKQAVCGHIRMHPERTWRGLNPRESSTWKPHASPKFDLSVLAAPEAQEKALASDKFDLNLSAPETLSAPKYYNKCMVCRKRFNSKQAVCGHMRMHPERTWRGLNPRESSTWKPHASPKFDLSVLAAPEAQEKALASDKFDLNLSAPETFLNFDLNKPALEEGDDNAY